MSALVTLAKEVDAAVDRGSDAMRARILALVTDLLVREDGRLDQEQIEVFDDVLGRYSGKVEAPARAFLAERLADLRHAPPNLIRSLALDAAIAVAGPILARSRQLDDQELMAAAETGATHRLAICRRPTIAECVTDILVSLGGQDVRLAVAGNNGAVLSEQSAVLLIDHSRDDEAMQISIGNRHDLSPNASRHLIEITRDLVRRQIMAAMAAEAAEAGDGSAPATAPDGTAPTGQAPSGEAPLGRDYRRAAMLVRQIAGQRSLTEADLCDFAAAGSQAEAICTVAALVGLSVAAAERICDGADFDLLLLVSKAQNWSWKTFAALVTEFWPIGSDGRQLARIEARFTAMTGAKARRILQLRRLGSVNTAAQPAHAVKPA